MQLNQPENLNNYAINWKLFKRLLAEPTVIPADKVIILSLLFRLCNKNYCFPSQGLIANDTGFSRRYVRTRIKKLKEMGLIDIVRGGHMPRSGWGYKSNTYYLNKFLYKVDKQSKESEVGNSEPKIVAVESHNNRTDSTY